MSRKHQGHSLQPAQSQAQQSSVPVRDIHLIKANSCIRDTHLLEKDISKSIEVTSKSYIAVGSFSTIWLGQWKAKCDRPGVVSTPIARHQCHGYKLITASTVGCEGIHWVSASREQRENPFRKQWQFFNRVTAWLTRRFFQRVEREAKSWYQLRHPNVLPLHGVCTARVGSITDSPLLVSPYCQQGTVMEYTVVNPHADKLKLVC